MSGYLAKVRLPLTIDERLDLLAIVAERNGCDVVWRVSPPLRHGGPRPKWFIVERRRK